MCQHFQKKSFQSAPDPALERTASFCTPAFLPQPGAGFHPLPWEQQPDAHSRLTRRVTLGTAKALSSLVFLNPEGQWDVSHGTAGRGHMGPCAHMGLTRGQTHPSELAQLCWLVLSGLEHGAFQLCQPCRAASTKRQGPAGLRFSFSPGKLPLTFSTADFTVCAQQCAME